MSDASGERHLRVVLEPANGSCDHDERAPLAPRQQAPSPAYGTHSDTPGPRGCHTLKRDGELCGAARRADGPYCNAHSGLGVAKNPAEWAPIAQRASADLRRRRAALRLELGITRPQSIRGMLRAGVYAERERVVSAALAGLDADSPTQRSKTALALIDAAEPVAKATAEVSLPTDPDGVNVLSMGELLALAESVGIEAPTLPTPQ